MHFRPSPADVPPLSRAQDVRLAQPDPAAPEDGPQLDGRHDVAQQPRHGGRTNMGRPQERVQRAGRHRQRRRSEPVNCVVIGTFIDSFSQLVMGIEHFDFTTG